MTYPIQTKLEARTQATYNTLIHALSFPAEPRTLADEHQDVSAFERIGETLLDLETTFFTPDERLKRLFLTLGARPVPMIEAEYCFFPSFDEQTLPLIQQAHCGNALYPDHAATLILAASLETGPSLRWSGPGIPESKTLKVDLPAEFWSIRKAAMQYPLGWDVFLVDDLKVVGLPRTTQVVEVD